MTVSQNGSAVMTVTIVTQTDGTYTYDVDQTAAIKHPDGTTEDNIDFKVNYKVTDGDGDSATGSFKVDVDDSLPTADIALANGENIPTLTTQDAQTIDTQTDTDSASFANLFTLIQDMGADDGGTAAVKSYALSVNEADSGLTSDGEAITLEMNGLVLEGSTSNGVVIFTVAVDVSTGEVTLTQNAEIDHNTLNNSVSNLGLATGNVVLTASATITDGDGDSAKDSQSLDISKSFSFDDDVPKAYDNEVSLAEGTASSSETNLLFVLDFSGSMHDDNNKNMDMMREGITSLLNAYKDNGGFNLKIVTFGGNDINGSTLIFHSVEDVDSYLNSVNIGGGTYYDDAIDKAMTVWNDSVNGLGANSTNSVAYFMSDGEPTRGSSLSAHEISTWETYVNNNFTKSIALGMGDNAPSDNDLKTVAHTPGGVDEIYIANDVTEITDALVGTVVTQNSTTGNVITDTNSSGEVDKAGADGFATPVLVSVTYDDGDPSTSDTYTFNATNTSFTIQTNAGEVVIKNDGSYTFTAKASVDADITDSITYTVIDTDGSTSSANLLLKVTNSVPVANVDTNSAQEGYWMTGSDTVVPMSQITPEHWDNSSSEEEVDGTWNINPSYTWGTDSDNTSSFSISADNAHQASVSVDVDLSGYRSGDIVKVTLIKDGNPVNGQSYTVSSDGTVTFSGISESGNYEVHVYGNDNSFWGNLKVELSDLEVTAYDYTPETVTKVDVTTPDAEWVAATLATGNVLENDDEGGAGGLTVTLVNGTDVTGGADIVGANGVLHIDETGKYTYTPNDTDMSSADLANDDVFNYTIKDTEDVTSNSTLTINVQDYDYSSGSTVVIGTDGNDVMYGGEITNTLSGGMGNDTIIADFGDTVDGGDGVDTLFLTTGSVIDLSGVGEITNIDNIEIVRLSENTELNGLSAQNVFDMTDSTNDLTVTGDGDVTLDSSWSEVGSTNIFTSVYTDLNNNTYEVQVDLSAII